ncbi:MAG: MBL fold metallo-hydrolase [Verrucomicrobia bacterium]|nr:MBL fold metallo-hydrolase [Verrucomicrobiota bacterium]
MVFEDTFVDVIHKATNGLGYKKMDLMERSGLSMLEIEACLTHRTDYEESIWKLAEALNLKPEALVLLARADSGTEPQIPDQPQHVVSLPTEVPGWDGMTVNSYLVGCPQAAEACLVDAGASPRQVQAVLQQRGWILKYFFLTHAHRDHIQQLGQLQTSFPNCTFLAPQGECPDGCQPITAGFNVRVGKLRALALATAGHSPAGTSYAFEADDSEEIVICCGDALFARSMGKVGKDHFHSALKTVKQALLSYPKHTVLAPGHGPLTSVDLELAQNPFLAE